MDPLTQGALGALLPQSFSRKSNLLIAGIFGFLSGMAADLDVFIRSDTDPLIFLEYHRQFTHSLIFIPVGGFVSAILLHLLIGKWTQLSIKKSILFCTLGYSTHSLLDACTSYGTMLFWPFSDMRISGNIISIIDPIFSLPILTLIILASIMKKRSYSHLALIWAIFYISLGAIQHSNAIEIGRKIAKNRGHELTRIHVKPSFANILVWKVIYDTPTHFHIDALRTGPFPRFFSGTSLAKLDLASDFPWLNPAGQQARDVERFRRFSDGYLARDPKNSNRIIDVRYSMLPNQVDALWSIELSRNTPSAQHVKYVMHHNHMLENFKKLMNMILANN